MMQQELKKPPLNYEAYLCDYQRRSELRKLNFDAPVDSNENGVQPKRNAQIKAIQKFIVKLKLDNKNHQALLVQMKQLNLSKYLQEISAILANSVSQREIMLLAEIATMLNVTYDSFPPIIIQDLTKAFGMAYESPEDNKGRLRTLLLFMTELYVCGFAFSYKTIAEFLKKVFQSGNKKKTIYNTEVQRRLFAFYYSCESFAAFLESFTEVFTKRTPKWVGHWADEGKETARLTDSVPNKVREELTAFFLKYISECKLAMEDGFQKIKEYELSLRDSLKMDGEMNKEAERKYNDLVEKYMDTKRNLVIICDALNEDQNQNQKEDSSTGIKSVDDIIKLYINKVEGAEIFEDEFQKEIYERLLGFPQNEEKTSSDADYRKFKQVLDSCKNASDADNAVLEFGKINNKKTRRMLSKDVLDYRKEYQLVTPYLCRVAATVHRSFRDIGEYINQALMSDYEKLREATSSSFVVNDKRSRNLKYICQFTKFQVVDTDRAITCIRNLIEDLKGHNIDLLISALESVGRYLYLSEQSASKFTFLLTLLENVMKKKSFPVFTTSQLINSINLLKPHTDKSVPEQIPKSSIQLRVEAIFSKNILGQLDQITEEISQILKTPEGMHAVTVEFMAQTQKYDFLGIYHYVYLLDQMDVDELNSFTVSTTTSKLLDAVRSGQNQKSLFWCKFLAELYKYNLMKRSAIYSTVEDLLRVENNQLGVINAVCTIFDTCEGFLKCKKVSAANKQFMILVAFKRFINSCRYVPMLEEFHIIDVFQTMEPNLPPMREQQIENFLQHCQNKISIAQFSLSDELNNWLDENHLKEVKKTEQMVDTRVAKTEEKNQKNQSTVEFSMPQFKAFDNQFTAIRDMYNKEFSNRIAKPIILERQIEKKKEKKPKDDQRKVINVIGRVGNKFVRKEIHYSKNGTHKE